MAQPSIANYFNTRKRPAADETGVNGVKKVLLLGENEPSKKVVRNLMETSTNKPDVGISEIKKINSPSIVAKKKILLAKTRKNGEHVNKLGSIESFLNNMGKNKLVESALCCVNKVEMGVEEEIKEPKEPKTPTKDDEEENHFNFEVMTNVMVTPTKIVEDVAEVDNITPVSVTPTKRKLTEPEAPKKLNALDKIKLTGMEPTLSELKHKMSRSERLADLKASLSRFKQKEKQLEAAEKRTQDLKNSPLLKNFKAIELEVNLSPQKQKSPEKPYLSPRKDFKARKNLFSCISPTKNALPMPTTKESIPVKESLTLPYKYRCLAEIFRAIDTVSQIMYNRKETITFKKLKPAVEEMLKRNLTEKHLAKIKFLYPEAFKFQREKLREFGTRRESWELIVTPNVDVTNLTSDTLLERRRKLFGILIEKIKIYHKEFLKTLDPPLEINHDKIARWHPEFNIEKVPDVELAPLPEAPNEEKLTTGSEVLEKARALFNCNTRMERALEKLKQRSHETQTSPALITDGNSILKGIPKALLEKVRQRQAAKAFETMTRSADKEKEAQLYAKLPEVARLTRNLFVSEKKSVLPLDVALDKLCNSFKAFSDAKEMEMYLKTIEKEIKGWLTFCEIRGCVYVKLSKGADLSLVVNKLRNLADQKNLP